MPPKDIKQLICWRNVSRSLFYSIQWDFIRNLIHWFNNNTSFYEVSAMFIFPPNEKVFVIFSDSLQQYSLLSYFLYYLNTHPNCRVSFDKPSSSSLIISGMVCTYNKKTVQVDDRLNRRGTSHDSPSFVYSASTFLIVALNKYLVLLFK